MSTLYRVVGMILLFFLLASVGIPTLAFPQVAQAGRVNPQQEAEPGLHLHQEMSTRETMPAALSPPWQRFTPAPVAGTEWEGPPIEPELLRALLQAEPDEYLRVIVHLREQTDLKTAIGGAPGATEARSRLVSALQANATRSQAPLRTYLEGARASGLVDSYTPFWIFNGIAVRARPSLIHALAAHPTVAAVHLDHYRQWLSTETRFFPKNLVSDSAVEWGVARIRADQVWASLHVSGTGVIVAGMDTGVDWIHPALQANYRGYNPHGPSNHLYSWYDATGDGASYPVDGHGHGTHTLGTAVGQGGIGVAPGARWIAAKVLNSQGFGFDSWIHEGFQWLLAPGSDPSKAPDVINASWSNDDGSLTSFQLDLQALRAAGIFAVFANGNAGPGEGTVGSPASLPEAFAVGATDSDDEVASFSGRGPSPWGEIRPHVVAPGVHVRSSLPGGAYDSRNGTSAATPHVAGLAALLRSVNPTLSVTRATFLITSTAVPLSTTLPNNDTGWGRVDAFAAVSTLAQSGIITGTVARAGDGAVIAGATVAAIPPTGGSRGTATTDTNGQYLLALGPTIYDLNVFAFGYAPITPRRVTVMTGTTRVEDFDLTALPTGTLRGRVTDAATSAPVTATVAVLDSPLKVTASAYTFTPPAGTYTLRASSLGYRVITTTAVVTAGQVTIADLPLPPAMSILLVDSGPWYYGSQIGYFRQALDDLAYTYDEWTIKHLPDDVPAAADLSPYDVVIWSAPEDAPAYIGAQHTITSYLSTGGRLLLSGQDVGYWDGGGSLFDWSTYYQDYLKARFVRDDAGARVLDGQGDDIFAGLTISITGPGGADNQDFPDEITVADPDAAAPVLTYRDDGCGGMRVGTCLDYRVIYLPFGFEAINDRVARREVMDRALAWLVAEPPTTGLELTPPTQAHTGVPGTTVTHNLRVRHVGQGGTTDTVSLSLDGVSWATQVSAMSFPMAPCTSATILVTVTVPYTAGWDARDVITLTAHSSLSPTLVQTAVLTSKAPAPILLVDDDRWYDQEAKYQAALAGNDFGYDYWHTDSANGEEPQGSPPSNVLQRYPIVVWFTGYDWYAPVTTGEATTLATYLDDGGRLFLSSQDFLLHHREDLFSRDYLGVMTHTEDVTPTLAYGVPENPIGDRLGPYSLDYPFFNWSDAVEPAPGTAVPFRDQERRPIALARQEGDYKTVFFSFPCETVPQAGRARVMEQVVGWLSWLGGSTFSADRGAASGGDVLTYTIALQNDGPEAVRTTLSNTLPSNLTLVPDSSTGPAAYDPPTQRFSWDGLLGPGAAITCTYRVTVAAGLPTGTPITNTARVGLEDQNIRFHRTAVVRAGAPDLSSSAFWCSPSPARPGAVVTCTVALANTGPGDASAATITNPLPADTAFVPDSLAWEGGGTAAVLTETVHWAGSLSAGGDVTLTYQITLPTHPAHPPLYSAAFLEDGTGGTWERATWTLLDPWRVYLPLVYRAFRESRRYYLPVVSGAWEIHRTPPPYIPIDSRDMGGVKLWIPPRPAIRHPLAPWHSAMPWRLAPVCSSSYAVPRRTHRV